MTLGRAYCRGPVKRVFDVAISVAALIVLAPVFLIVSGVVFLTSRRPVLFTQERVGMDGCLFRLFKFRTMHHAAAAGLPLTGSGDPRVTPLGRFLRAAKLDELPQLWNVLKGEMSLVGPRPEVPRYVRHYTPEQRAILRFKPGITDLASLCFRNEEALLGNADDLEEFYVRHCLPRKLQLNQDYVGHANLFSDTWIILQTICPYWIGVLICYGIILAASFSLSCGLIYDFAPLPLSTLQFWRELGMTLALQLVCLTLRKQWRGLLSYFSLRELRRV